MTSGCPYASLQQSEPHPDPYAVYAEMRAKHGPVVPVELEPGLYGWLVTDYATLIAWCQDSTTFGHDPRLWKDYREGRVRPDSSLLPMMAPRMSAVFVDGAEHQRYRRSAIDSLASVSSERLGELTRRYTNRLIDEFCERGEADLLDEYARMVPLLVFSELFGCDEEQAVRFVTATRNLWVSVDTLRSQEEAHQGLYEVVLDKRRNPKDDLPSQLIQHPAALSDEEVVMQLLMFVAATNMNTDLIEASLRAVLTDPGAGTDVAYSDTALANIFDEVLWKDPPMYNYPVIYPRVDVPLGGGRVIEAGTPVLLALAAANRFFLEENAEQLEESANRAHVTWLVGPHRCPARDEATTITLIAMRTLLTRLPGLRLGVPQEDLRWHLTTLMWSPVELPVQFTPQPRQIPAEDESPSRSDAEEEPSLSAESSSSGSGRRPSLAHYLRRLLRRS